MKIIKNLNKNISIFQDKSYLMKFLILIFVFFLPFHAVIITFLKCKIWINTDILRFWKEWIIIFLLFLTFLKILLKQKKDILKFLLNEKPLFISLIFTLISFLYIFLPDFKITIAKLLWFKYDVFFIFCLIIWLYLFLLQKYFNLILKTLFVSTLLILWIFLPWYLFWNIWKTSEIIWYSKEVSTYKANSCIPFAQNITWWNHRMQWSFWDPIRFWVFLVIVYFILLWFFLDKINLKKDNKIFFLTSISIIFITSIYFSYTKTTIIWFIFWFFIFWLLYFTYIKNIKINKKYILILILWIFLVLSNFIYIKKDLFLHPKSLSERTTNLITWSKMIINNPFWYWLWITWPASQLATSNDEKLNRWVKKFLVENWYLQILLESWIFGFSAFIFLLFTIFKTLLNIIKAKKDILWVGILTSFSSILLMWNFTHIFEERRTSFLLFLIIWLYIKKHNLK